MKPHHILLIPFEKTRTPLLDQRIGSRPPMAIWSEDYREWELWTPIWDLDPDYIPGGWLGCRDRCLEHGHAALILAWGGKLADEGIDRAARAFGLDRSKLERWVERMLEGDVNAPSWQQPATLLMLDRDSRTEVTL